MPRPIIVAQSGTGGVIKGWDDGVGTMKLGERYVRAALFTITAKAL
jgi:FKBP-type peptidyl-prolyl cis-trans isomerase